MKNPISDEMLAKIFKTSPQNPDRLIKREDKNHEFKEAYNNANMAMYLKTMAAFANNDGGYIIFGIKDSPRLLLGLSEKSLQQFSELPTEKLTQLLNDYFAPSIEWTSCIYLFKGKSFGVIYVYSLNNKPAICKKSKDAQNNKYALKEADIYYRYSGKSERIKYAELQKIIDDKRKNEEKQWLHFLMKAARIGVENASILDLNKGELQEGGNRLVLDEEHLEKMRFVKEGQFVERYGAPTLRWVGDFNTLESGKIVVKTTRKVITALEQTDIVEAFLKNEIVENPCDYIKRICSSTTGNLPVYYYITIGNLTKETALRCIEETTARGQAKRTLIKKIKSFEAIPLKIFPEKETESSKTRKKYASCWINENLNIGEDGFNLKQCLTAISYISSENIAKHLDYIKTTLLELYKEYYETADGSLAGCFRDAICYIDSAIYFSSINKEAE